MENRADAVKFAYLHTSLHPSRKKKERSFTLTQLDNAVGGNTIPTQPIYENIITGNDQGPDINSKFHTAKPDQVRMKTVKRYIDLNFCNDP